MSELKKVPKAPGSEATISYDSNPFTQSFKAFGKFFSSNANWAIAIIVIGILGFVLQSLNSVFRYIFNSRGVHNVSTASSFSSVNSSSSSDILVFIAIAVVILVIIVVAVIIGTAVSSFINGMFSYVALKSQNDENVSFSEALNETTKRFWRLYIAQMLANLKIFGWTLLFIIPGIIAGYRYQLLPYLIMNEPATEKGVGDSHDKTKALVSGRKWEVFGISTVAGIIPFVGSIIGLAGKAGLFQQLNNTRNHPEDRPRIHWLNYLGLILTGLAFIFIMLFIFIIVSSITGE